MASAGKIAPTWDSNGYDSTKTYEYYTMLMHNNKLWICKKDGTIGIEPSTENSTNWFLAMDSSFTDADTLDGYDSTYFATAESITNIEDGTTQVGNAKKLDGHEAEYFVNRGEALESPLLEKALEVGKGVHHFIFSGSNMPADDLPSSTYRYGSATVIKRGDNSITVIVWGSTNNSYVHFLPKFNYYNAGTWTGWKGIDDFLPLSADSTMATRTVGRSSNNPLILKNTNTNSNQSVLGFQTETHGTLGKLGFYGVDVPTFVKGDGSAYYTLLHTGNKPSGSYTGNGSATERTIAVNGLSKAFIIRPSGSGHFSVVTSNGYIAKFSDSVMVGIDAYVSTNGNIALRTSHGLFNEAGITYEYISL